MGILGWVGIAFAVVVLLVVVFVVLPLMAYARRQSAWEIAVHYVTKPVLTNDDVQRALDAAMPGAKLSIEKSEPDLWIAAHELGEVTVHLIDEEEPMPSGPPARFSVELRIVGRSKPDDASNAMMLAAMSRLAVPLAKMGGVALTVENSSQPDSRKAVLLDDANIAKLEAGLPRSPKSIRDMFLWGEEKSPRTFSQQRITVQSSACLRHFFEGERSFDWPAVEAELTKRGWRATAREAKPGVMLFEFPELQVSVNDVKRAAWVMFELKGTRVEAPKLHAQSLVELAVPTADAWWKYLLYDNNNGLPAYLRLRLLAEVSRALSLQHAPLVLAWDDAGHLVAPSVFVAATEEKDEGKLAELVVGLRMNRVANAPDESKSTFSSTTGLADFGLPEIEMISSSERAKKFAPLLTDTAVQLLLRGPVFADGHTVGHDDSADGKLRVLYAQSLADEHRFVLSLS